MSTLGTSGERLEGMSMVNFTKLDSPLTSRAAGTKDKVSAISTVVAVVFPLADLSLAFFCCAFYFPSCLSEVLSVNTFFFSGKCTYWSDMVSNDSNSVNHDQAVGSRSLLQIFPFVRDFLIILPGDNFPFK